MEPAPTIKDPSINNPIYNQRIVIGYTKDQQGQNIQDEDVVRPDNHKWARNCSGETHELLIPAMPVTHQRALNAHHFAHTSARQPHIRTLA